MDMDNFNEGSRICSSLGSHLPFSRLFFLGHSKELAGAPISWLDPFLLAWNLLTFSPTLVPSPVQFCGKWSISLANRQAGGRSGRTAAFFFECFYSLSFHVHFFVPTRRQSRSENGGFACWLQFILTVRIHTVRRYKTLVSAGEGSGLPRVGRPQDVLWSPRSSPSTPSDGAIDRAVPFR